MLLPWEEIQICLCEITDRSCPFHYNSQCGYFQNHNQCIHQKVPWFRQMAVLEILSPSMLSAILEEIVRTKPKSSESKWPSIKWLSSWRLELFRRTELKLSDKILFQDTSVFFLRSFQKNRNLKTGLEQTTKIRAKSKQIVVDSPQLNWRNKMMIS